MGSFNLRRPAYLAAVAALVYSCPAVAQTRSFDVPAQSASRGIPAFARQAGVQIIARGDVVRGIRTNAVRGDYSVEEALALLLKGTRLVVRTPVKDGAIIVVERTREAADAADERRNDIVVTGTNIRGAEPTSPVTVITAQDIERSGYTSADQLVRSMTQAGSSSGPTGFGAIGAMLNTEIAVEGGENGVGGFGVNEFSAGSGINLRGLGEGQTLILVNGRRLAAGGSSAGQTTDISGIPLNSIERIEILPNSASAIYGADAVGGVVNVILKKNYRGLELSGRYGLSSTLADDRSLTGSAGVGWSSGRAMLTGNYQRIDAVQVAKLGTPIGDQRSRGGADFRTDRCQYGLPGELPVIIALPGNGLPRQCFYGPAGSGIGLTLADFILASDASEVRYTESNAIELQPTITNLAFTGTLSQKLIGTWGMDLTGMWSRRESLARVVPSYLSVVVPVNNPFNPFGRRVRTYYDFHKEMANGLLPYTQQYASFTSMGGSASLHGDLPFASWEADISASFSRNVTRAHAQGVRGDAIQTAIQDTDPATALNVFGDGTGQNAATLQGLSGRTDYPRWISEERQAIARANGDLVTLPTGIVKASVGGEFRRPTITRTVLIDYTDLVADGTYSRDQYSAFAELLVPLVPGSVAGRGRHALTLTLAGRQDWYRAIGVVPKASAFTERVGLAWDVFPALTVRGQYSTSFKVPYNDLLFRPQVTDAAVVTDPKRGGEEVAIESTTGGNPELKNQTATSYSGGFEVRLLDNRLTASVDYYRTDFVNLVFTPSTTSFLEIEDLYPQFFRRGPAGPGETVGPLLYMNNVAINAASFNTSGIDFSLNYRLNTPSAGDFNLRVQATEVLTRERRLLPKTPVRSLRTNSVYGAPLSMHATLDWSKGPVGATLAADYSGPTTNPVYVAIDRSVDSLTTFDAQIRVKFGDEQRPFKGFTLSIGATNLFDTKSPFLDSDYGIDFFKWDPRGRVVYLTLGKSIG